MATSSPKDMMLQILQRLENIERRLDNLEANGAMANTENQMRIETLSSKLDLLMTMHTQPVVVKKTAKKTDKKKEDAPAPGAACDIAAIVLEDEKTRLQDEVPYPHLQSRWPLARPQKKQTGINRVMYFNRAYDADPETFSEYITPDVKKAIHDEFKKDLDEKKNEEDRRLFLRQKYYRYMATHHSAKLIFMKNQYNAGVLAASKVLAVKEPQPTVSVPVQKNAADIVLSAAAVKSVATINGAGSRDAGPHEYDFNAIVNGLESDVTAGDDDASAEEYEDEDEDT